jgi:hypothetical protein
MCLKLKMELEKVCLTTRKKLTVRRDLRFIFRLRLTDFISTFHYNSFTFPMASMSFSAVPRRAPVAAPTTDAPRRAWGSSGNSGRSDFDPAASAAFGKKPARMEPPAAEPSPVVHVTPARNTLASKLEGILPDDPAPKQKQWAKSALQQQREAARAEAAKKAAPPPKTFEEEFPALGGGRAAAVKVPKPVISMNTETSTREGGTSFASLAAQWAKADEEKRYMESILAQQRMEKQRLEDMEMAERRRFYNNLQANRQYGGGGGGYYDEDNYGSGDDYIEGELGEAEYSAADLRAEKRAMERRYQEEYYEDDDEENY